MRSALVTLAGIALVSVPLFASAQNNIAGSVISAVLPLGIQALTSGSTLKADAMCTGDPAEAYPTDNNRNGVPGVIGKPCFDVTNGFKTTGVCTTVQKCQATGTSGNNGFGIDKVAGILGQLMTQLMSGSKSGQGTPAATAPTTATGCTTGTYITSVVSSDPCAVFVPAAITSGDTPIENSNITSALLDALNGGSTPLDTVTTVTTGSSTTDILDQFSNPSGTQASVTGQMSSTTVNPAGGNVFGQSVNLLPGIRGDISVLNNGATFVVNDRDQAGNTEVAGFYGSDTTLGSQPTGLVASWCQSRPWAKNFLSVVISPTFFDSLCKLRGYSVGAPPVSNTQSQVTITQSNPQPVKATTTVVTPSTIAPKVDIWASPASVSLGARTSIFWTSSNAASCAVTSSDGSFSQRSLTGGASTVSITAATIFTISCASADGALRTTKSVTVQLAI